MHSRFYDLKFWQELGWGVLIAVVVFLMQALTGLPDDWSEWQTWATPLVAGAARIAAAAVLVAIGKASGPTPTDDDDLPPK